MFLANDEGNLDQKHLQYLYDWTDAYKSERLEKVADPHARNLVSRLLMKDPSKRPDTSHVLAHPFFSGKRAARMIGEEAEYDVFLSYRVNSDSHHCELLYEMMTKRGLKVWWDKKCLQPGVDWEEGFCDGLIKSRAFVALLSRGGLQNFDLLTESSRCDNVLLEYRLALELHSFNLLEALFPVMIGDSSSECTDPTACIYTDYFNSGCSPKCPDIVVKSVETKLHEHLNSQGLGDPVGSNCTVKDIYQALTKHQGGFIVGGDAFTTVVESINSMIRNVRNASVADAGSENETFLVKRSEWDHRLRELDILRSQKSEWDDCQRELNILRLGITNINALTSDTAGIIDIAGQNSYSKISKVTNKSNDIISCLYSIYISMLRHMFIFQDVARDVVNSVRSNVVNAMKSVQELRQSQVSDSQRTKEFSRIASENISDTVERGKINQTTGNKKCS